MNPHLTAWSRLQTRDLTVQQSRDVDQLAIHKYRMNSLVLMENAALNCAAWCQQKFSSPQVTTILCGRGNNGGDGLAIARHLTNYGWPCTVVLQGPIDTLSRDSLTNYEILTIAGGVVAEVCEGPMTKAGVEQLLGAKVIIDALLGTGARGSPRAPLDGWIELANQAQAFRLAIDVPTGVDAETGEHSECYFWADATLTFVSKKPAMSRADTRSLFGDLAVLPIGIPAQMMLEILEWPC